MTLFASLKRAFTSEPTAGTASSARERLNSAIKSDRQSLLGETSNNASRIIAAVSQILSIAPEAITLNEKTEGKINSITLSFETASSTPS